MRINLSYPIMFIALAAAQPSIADTIAVLPGDGGFQSSDYGDNVTLGWGFTLGNTVTVTGLGYFDGNAGLTDAHPVGIWNSIGVLLAEATIPSGATADLAGGFRFVSIAPVILGAGAYSIGGYANDTSPDEFRFEVSSVTTVAGLSFGPTNLYTKADSLTQPTTKADAFSQDGYFGPNFEVGSATTAPEPDSIEVSLIGMLAIMLVFRSRRGRPVEVSDGPATIHATRPGTKA
jgi:uncharacterized protein DUF4082